MKQNRFLQSNRLSKYGIGASLIVPEDNESIDDLYNELLLAIESIEGYDVEFQINRDGNYIFYRFKKIKVSN